MLGLGLGLQNGRPRKTIVNLLASIGNFETDSNSDGVADGWTGQTIANASVSNNIQIFTPTALNGEIYNTSVTGVANDKIYACFWVKTSGLSTSVRFNSTRVTGMAYTTHTGNGDWELLSVYGTKKDDINTGVLVISTLSSEWSEIQVKLACAFNLTKDLGLGNELIKEEMDAIVQSNGYFDYMSI